MTALLLVLMFVLTIFMIMQFVLRSTITTQDTQLNYLSQQVSSLAKALGLEQQRSDGLETEVAQLDGKLTTAKSRSEIQNTLIATLSQQTKNQHTKINAFKAKVSSFEAQVASLLAQNRQLVVNNTQLGQDVTAAQTTNTTLSARISKAKAATLKIISEKEALQLALAKARNEIDVTTEQARLAAAKREALEALIAETQTNLRNKDNSLQAALAALGESRTALGNTKVDMDRRLAQLAAELTASQTANQDEVKSAKALHARLDILEKGLTDSEKQRVAIEAAAASLRARLATSQTNLSEKEKAQLAEAAAAQALRKRLANTRTALSEAEKSQLVEAAAAEALRQKLKNSQAELTAMTLALEQQRKQAEDTLTLLAAARAARKDLNLSLAEALTTQKKFKDDALAARQKAAGAGRAAAQKIAALENDRTNLNARLAAIVAKLEATGSESDTLLAAADAERSKLEARLAAALAAKLAAENAKSDTLSKAQQQRILLAAANVALSSEKARSAEAMRKIEVLNQQTATLRKQLNSLQAVLDDAKTRDEKNQVQISALGSNLNIALAQKAAEQKRRAELEEAARKRLEARAKDLEKYKSEFFGKMRELLGNRKGVRIVGDRFVFSSEVLFSAGSVDLSTEGKAQIAKVAEVIHEVSGEIPKKFDWILRVDGHTDNVPLTGNGKYKDNWELSQGRALSVVRYLIDSQGIQPKRLAAAGFGQYQPIASDDTPEGRAQNRRIEMKFTER